MCGFLSVQGNHSATNAVWRLAYWGSTPHSTAQVKLITAWPQTTALGLPHGWELVNQVGVVALFAGRSSQWASYFGVPVVLLIMHFMYYSQVLPIVKRRGIIPRSEPATEKKFGQKFHPMFKNRIYIAQNRYYRMFSELEQPLCFYPWNQNRNLGTRSEDFRTAISAAVTEILKNCGF